MQINGRRAFARRPCRRHCKQSYHLVGLSVYLAKGFKDAGWLPADLTADEVGALALPLMVFASWAFMERVRRLSMKAQAEEKVN